MVDDQTTSPAAAGTPATAVPTIQWGDSQMKTTYANAVSMVST